MHIQVLRNLGRGLPLLNEGQVCEVDSETGEMLIGRGLAIEVSADTITAVPPEPLMAVSEPVVSNAEDATNGLASYRKKTKREKSE